MEKEDASYELHNLILAPRLATSAPTLARAAEIFRAMGDLPRLRLLDLMRNGEIGVTELAAATGINLSTLSQQLRVLRMEDLITSRRQGKKLFYSLADQHVANLLDNILAHSNGDCLASLTQSEIKPQRSNTMTAHLIHEGHTHQHGSNCGHTAVQHDDHVDYLHDGHLHHLHEGHVDEHILEVNANNPDICTPNHHCGAHEEGHIHGADCGHEQVPHGDHVDYLVAGHLHHPHGSHCDNHGPLAVI